MTPAPQAGAHTRVSSCAVHGAKSRSELGFQGRGAEFALIDHAFIVGRVEKQVGTEQTAYGRRCPGHIFLVLEQKRVVVDGLGIEALIGGMEAPSVSRRLCAYRDRATRNHLNPLRRPSLLRRQWSRLGTLPALDGADADVIVVPGGATICSHAFAWIAVGKQVTLLPPLRSVRAR